MSMKPVYRSFNRALIRIVLAFREEINALTMTETGEQN